ncbi:hypothetical protein CPB85DRAFT_1432260 [Mucidula mucida]|nr:hypothetical protein CPB85DRAFT_1432260 [Mucidula mucida]
MPSLCGVYLRRRPVFKSAVVPTSTDGSPFALDAPRHRLFLLFWNSSRPAAYMSNAKRLCGEPHLIAKPYLDISRQVPPPESQSDYYAFAFLLCNYAMLAGARVEPRLLTRFLMGYPRVKSLHLRNVAFLEDDLDARTGTGCPLVEELILSEPKSFFTVRPLPTHAYPFSLNGVRRLAIFNGPESPAPWKDMEPLLNAVQRTAKILYLSHYLTEINAAEAEIVSVLTMALRIPSVTIETLYMESTSLHFLYLFMTMLRDALVGARVRVKELGIIVALHHTVSKPPKVETWHILAAVLEQSAIQTLHITFTNGGLGLTREAFHRLPVSEWEKEILGCFTSMRQKIEEAYRRPIG